MGAHDELQTASGPSVIMPGNFDGVHLGHRALIARARSHADRHGLLVRPLTFDPHPAAILAPQRALTVLTTQGRRAELLEQAGADSVIVQPFDQAFAALSPQAFLRSLVDQGARALVVGPDFRFGKNRAGDVELLKAFGAREDLEVMIEPPVVVDQTRVSSSEVRTALAAGALDRVAQLLGRVHDVSGEVVKGHQRGRQLGFPTANLDSESVLHPGDGVYAVVARRLDGPRSLLQGVANIGVRPTFDAGRSVEAHLFDFDGDLYGTRLRVGFVARLRGEQRFDSLTELKTQIDRDCQAARDALKSLDEETLAWI